MAELRFILLIAGLVFLVVLAAWELRKPRQAPGNETLRRPARSEPEFGTFSMPAVEPRRPVMVPPRIDLPETESIMAGGDALEAPLPPMPIEPAPVVMVEEAPTLESAPTQEAAAPVSAPPAPAAAQPNVLVDWPPEGERHIVSLRIVSATGERLSGRTVRLAVTACGFRHGAYGIYHQPDSGGRAVLSVANLSKPGVLDPVNLDFQRLTGINLFTVLPGPLPPAAALDHLLDTARELSQRLPGRVQDEHGQPLDAVRLEDLRDRMQALSSSGYRAEPAA